MTGANPNSGNRMVLLLIGGIPLTMILVATWLWFFVANGEFDLVGLLGTANRGSLVQPPRQFDEHTLQGESGLSVKFADMEPRWAIIVPVASGGCDEACEKSLYVTRQIHVAMGKGFTRLRRLYVSPERAQDTQLTAVELSDGRPAPAGEFTGYLATEHAGLKVLAVPTGAYEVMFSEHAADTSTWYLVDPAGWIMMSYNEEIPYKDVIKDLKFLLKNSGG